VPLSLSHHSIASSQKTIFSVSPWHQHLAINDSPTTLESQTLSAMTLNYEWWGTLLEKTIKLVAHSKSSNFGFSTLPPLGKPIQFDASISQIIFEVTISQMIVCEQTLTSIIYSQLHTTHF
jgi:hypothetical protein